MEVVVTTAPERREKLQSNLTTNKPTSNFLQAGCPSCHPTNSVKAVKLTNYNSNMH